MRARAHHFLVRYLAVPLVAATFAGSMATRGSEPEPAPALQRPSLGARSGLSLQQLDDAIKPARDGATSNGILELRGPTDAAMRQRFDEAVAAGGVSAVNITSPGGDIREALHIATVIESRGIDVVVHDFCLGACAQYIFVAGRKRQLEKLSLVGFINSFKSNAMLLAMATDTLEVDNTMEPAMGRLVAVEEELYRRRGVSAALLVDPHVALQPQCVTLRRGANGIAWNMASAYILWVPSREYLKAAGVEFEGEWPKSRFTLGGLANRHLKINASIFVRYGDEDHHRSKKQPPYTLEQVRKCVLDAVPTSDAAPG